MAAWYRYSKLFVILVTDGFIMRNTTSQCTYRHVNLMYCKRVGGEAVYSTINSHACDMQLVGCISHNES